MNILFLCDEYPPCKHGGIGSITQTLAREIVKQNHKVFVLGFYPYYREAASEEIDNGVYVKRFFYGNWITLHVSRNRYLGRIFNLKYKFQKYLEEIKLFIHKNKIDIIEIPDFNEIFRYTGIQFIEFGDLGIPKIIKLHGTYSLVNHLKKPFKYNKHIYLKEKNHIQCASHVVAVSNFTKQQVKQIFDYTGEIIVIYNGVSIDTPFEYLINNSKKVIYVGRITKEKGVFSLIKAWENVIKLIPDATLILYGTAGKKTLKKLKENITDKSSHSISFAGFIDKTDLRAKYTSAACSVFPSYFENFSLAPIEAMQYGCPTIYTKRASGEELINNGIDGILVDPDNIDEISNAIIWMLTNRKEARTMGKKGFEKVKENFEMSKIVYETIQLYKNILKTQKT